MIFSRWFAFGSLHSARVYRSCMNSAPSIYHAVRLVFSKALAIRNRENRLQSILREMQSILNNVDVARSSPNIYSYTAAHYSHMTNSAWDEPIHNDDYFVEIKLTKKLKYKKF